MTAVKLVHTFSHERNSKRMTAVRVDSLKLCFWGRGRHLIIISIVRGFSLCQASAATNC